MLLSDAFLKVLREYPISTECAFLLLALASRNPCTSAPSNGAGSSEHSRLLMPFLKFRVVGWLIASAQESSSPELFCGGQRLRRSPARLPVTLFSC